MSGRLWLRRESLEFGARGVVRGVEAEQRLEVGARLVDAVECAPRESPSVVHLHEQRAPLSVESGGGGGGVGVAGEHIERERAVGFGGRIATCECECE